MRIHWILWMGLLALTGTSNLNANVSVSASIERSTMSVGETNYYTLTIRNASASPDIDPPQADGLQFRPNRQVHTSTQIINNRLTSEIRLSWPFQASRTGRFEVPGRTITIDGESYTINSVSVRVSEMPEEMRNRFFMRWQLEPGPWFVGQNIEASLKLYVRPDINARRAGQLSSSVEGIVQPNLNVQGRQFRENVDGTNYIVIAWDTLVTPIRAGEVSINTQLPLVYETGRVQRDFWGARPIQEEVILSTPDANWVVRELPRSSRPQSFSGAIGDFDVHTRLSSDEVRQGDPITLTLQLQGRGNLDRIDAPAFPESSAWRVYPPRTDVSFIEDSKVEGLVEIEYILSARQSGDIEIPEMEFSWFNPKEQEYKKHQVPAQTVRVLPDPSTGQAAVRPTSPEALQVDSELRPLATRMGSSGNLQPVWHQPIFWTSQAGSAIALAILVGVLQRRRQISADPLARARRAAHQQSRKLATAAKQAAQASDALAFYSQACLAIANQMAGLDPVNIRAESVSADQLERIGESQGLSSETITKLQKLFDRKDSAQFAGWKPGPDVLENDLKELQASLRDISERNA